MKRTISAVMLLLALTACNKTTPVEQFTVSEAVAVDESPVTAPIENSGKSAQDAMPETDYTSQKIIKNASIRFETEDLLVTADAVKNAVKKYKAQIQSDAEGNSDYTLTRSMIVRIPSQHFESFIAEISKGVKYFDAKEISSEDVTEQYVDTEARLKAKKVLEARYLELIGKAKKVSEILEIEKELSAIREEIEAKEGQLRYMKNRVALSTINLEFYKKTAELPDATVSYGSKIWNAVKSGFNSISSFFIDLLYFWPFILIFVIAFYIVRKKLKKKK
ncbi:DUF4349 domain-containing protein [Flavobacterium cerinum]|uniref:DUF4349 domain-containing protein n=1 Tax=Flavobacterium cerinum TaxID=2502784 RepID=A0A3S4T146_9FLAO|nr:DUF4349 domain-containing protein [Flavobacterium cerinum]RWX00101.1 DUF4349 domain-containing protein [Flavobacterium cerinum]